MRHAGDGLAGAICADHLSRIGVQARIRCTQFEEPGRPSIALNLDDNGTCLLGVASNSAYPETLAQATTGLMSVHGRSREAPRRLGLNVASVAAGILATQAALALAIARHRGVPATHAETGLLEGALQFLHHHLAIATCGDTFPFRAQGIVGTPFPTKDGALFELEALSSSDWVAFWHGLGLHDRNPVAKAWLPFVYRYLAGDCRLPGQLHEASRRHTFDEIETVAAAAGVGVSKVRTSAAALADSPALWTITAHAAAPSPSAPTFEHPGGILGGLRVVDLGSRLQAPLAALLLHMMGAEVIRVEPPGGDFGRASPPMAGDAGAAYLAYNRGKSVIEVDYKTRAGRAEILELAHTADVLLHNWPPGRAESLRLEASDVARSNPLIIYAHASGWGTARNAPSWMAGDFLVQAHAGCAANLNPPGEPIRPSGVTLVDVVAGLLTCEAVLAALLLRERDGCGRRVDTCLLAAGRLLQIPPRCRWGPFDYPILTGDGYLMISVDGEHRERLGRMVGGHHRSDHLIARRLSEGTAHEWEQKLRRAHVPAAVICDDLAHLPRHPALGSLIEQIGDTCWAPAAPWRFTDRSIGAEGPALEIAGRR